MSGEKCKQCGGLMDQQYDRKRCVNCGRSVWKDFSSRKPSKNEAGGGRPTGPVIRGKDLE